MKKLLYILILAALLIGTAKAAQTGLVYHEIQVVDEIGRPVTDLTNLYIYAPGGTTDAVIYMDRGLQNVITIPMTEASANTTLVDGFAYWWGPDGWDFSMSNEDAMGPLTNSGHIARTASDNALVFPSYLQSMSTTAWLDAQSISMGTGAEWVINGGGVADTLSFVPAADNSSFIVGSVNPSYTSSFYVPTGAADGLTIASAAFTWSGGAVLLNDTSNNNVGICTGTSTGATSIGNSAGGAFAVDTDSTVSINADDSMALTVSAGDITIDSVTKSVIIDGAEAADDAINIDSAAGGLDVDVAKSICLTTTESESDSVNIDSAGGVDIDIAGGAAGEDFAVTTDTSITLVTTEAVADQFKIDAQGAVTGNAINLETTSGGIILTADHATNGDITLDSEDDLILTSTGKVTITNTEVVTISGGATITGTTTIASALVTPVEVVAATNEIEITESGKVFVLNHATEFVTTLPTVATSAGVTFRFIIGAAPADADYTIVTDTFENKIFGMVLEAETDTTEDGPVAQDEDTITFVRAVAVVGDWVELTSDGVNWYVSGMTAADGGVTLTAAD